jgi:hypothetical protein
MLGTVQETTVGDWLNLMEEMSRKGAADKAAGRAEAVAQGLPTGGILGRTWREITTRSPRINQVAKEFKRHIWRRGQGPGEQDLLNKK